MNRRRFLAALAAGSAVAVAAPLMPVAAKPVFTSHTGTIGGVVLHEKNKTTFASLTSAQKKVWSRDLWAQVRYAQMQAFNLRFPGMNYQNVNSSNITAIGYDADERKLGVRFSNGSHWQYTDVPPEIHVQLVTGRKPDDTEAPRKHSVGRAFVELVKGRFPGEQVEKPGSVL